jgi:catechol-2,3-dioxygenase
MEIKELGHLVLRVGNLENSVHFYRDVLGFKEVARMGNDGVMFSSGRTHHELFLRQADPAATPASRASLGLSHFALKIGTTDEELEAALAELATHGVTPDHVTDHGGVTHSVYLRDPDGNRVEIYIDVQPETWRENPGAIAGEDQRVAASGARA